MSSNVCERLKFGKVSRKDLLCTKMEKNGYQEFHHSGTLIHCRGKDNRKTLIRSTKR